MDKQTNKRPTQKKKGGGGGDPKIGSFRQHLIDFKL